MKQSQSREDAIASWMASVVKEGKIGLFDDLHVDQIDAGWKDRKHWLSAGAEALRIAAEIRNKRGYAADVTLAFSLTSGETPRGAHFRDPASFESELDWSPPSLYLDKPGVAPWDQGVRPDGQAPVDLKTQKLDAKALGFGVSVKACYFMEFRPADSPEYSRTVLLVG